MNVSALNIYRRAGFEIIWMHQFDVNGEEYGMLLTLKRFKEVNPMSEKVTVYFIKYGRAKHIFDGMFFFCFASSESRRVA